MRFDLPAELPEGTITSATLSLYCYRDHYPETSYHNEMCLMTQSWIPDTVTWESLNGVETEPVIATNYYPNDFVNQWDNFDVTEAVQSFAAGTSNYGFMIGTHRSGADSPGPTDDWHAYYSSRYRAEIDKRPKLTLNMSTTLPVVAIPELSPQTSCIPDELDVSISCATSGAAVHYTTDGSTPTEQSPIYTAPITLNTTTTVKARAFRSGMAASLVPTEVYTLGPPAVTLNSVQPGVFYRYYEGLWVGWGWDGQFDEVTPLDSGIVSSFDLSLSRAEENWGFEYLGYINIPQSGEYTFYVTADDGGNLYIGDTRVVTFTCNQEKYGSICLTTGYHRFYAQYWNGPADFRFDLSWSSDTFDEEPFPFSVLVTGIADPTDVVFPGNKHVSAADPLIVREGVNGLSYHLKQTSQVELVIYNSTGKIVQMLNTMQGTGKHTVRFKKELTNGQYFYCLKACGLTHTSKIAVIR